MIIAIYLIRHFLRTDHEFLFQILIEAAIDIDW